MLFKKAISAKCVHLLIEKVVNSLNSTIINNCNF